MISILCSLINWSTIPSVVYKFPFTSNISKAIFSETEELLYSISCLVKGYNAEEVFPVPIVPVTKIFWNKPFSGIKILEWLKWPN